MNRTLSSLVLAGGLLAGVQAIAGDLMHWQTYCLTYLYGQDFKIDPEIQQSITFEPACGWAIGDLFLFVFYFS
jgi:nucleoside-specific outer membrane channel protein Tsx